MLLHIDLLEPQIRNKSQKKKLFLAKVMWEKRNIQVGFSGLMKENKSDQI